MGAGALNAVDKADVAFVITGRSVKECGKRFGFDQGVARLIGLPRQELRSGVSCSSLLPHHSPTVVNVHHLDAVDPIRPLFPKTSRFFTLGNSIRQPLGGIHDPDALVLPGRLVDPGDQQFGIRIADPQQRVNLPPESIRR